MLWFLDLSIEETFQMDGFLGKGDAIEIGR